MYDHGERVFFRWINGSLQEIVAGGTVGPARDRAVDAPRTDATIGRAESIELVRASVTPFETGVSR